jgi:hypothetical protein
MIKALITLLCLAATCATAAAQLFNPEYMIGSVRVDCSAFTRQSAEVWTATKPSFAYAWSPRPDFASVTQYSILPGTLRRHRLPLIGWVDLIDVLNRKCG